METIQSICSPDIRTLSVVFEKTYVCFKYSLCVFVCVLSECFYDEDMQLSENIYT